MELSRHIRAHRALLIGLTAQLLQYGSALMLVPFMVTRLSKAEIGLWYIFVAIQSLAFICDFGFQPTFTRAFALGISGASKIERRGLGEEIVIERTPNFRLIAETMAAAKIFYRLLAGLILLALVGAGLPYVAAISGKGGLDIRYAEVAWLVFAVSIGLNLYFLWVDSALVGFGRVEQNYLYIIVNRAASVTIAIGALLVGGGLIAVAGALIVGQVIARTIAIYLLGDLTRRCRAEKVERHAVYAVLRAIWPNASRMGAVSIGAFLINRYTLFAISAFGGLAVVGPYALALQMLSAVTAVAQMPMQISLSKLVNARVKRNTVVLRQTFIMVMAIYVITALIGAAFIVMIVPIALKEIASNIMLLPTGALIILTLVLILEGLHATAATFITTANDVPFVRAALASGIAITISVTIAGWLGWGVAAMIACQGLVQLTYNNWYWPWQAWKSIET